jgi:hypothetical protein
MAKKQKRSPQLSRKNHLSLVKPHYTLCYGMRLDKGTAPERRHPHVPVLLPDGDQGSMTLHVMNGTVDDIKAQLLESIDAFFEIYGES